MDTTLHSAASSSTRQFREALRTGDLDAADRMLRDWGGDVPAGALADVGRLHMARRRWRQARATFDRIDSPDLSCRLSANLAGNLAALKRRRPRLYRKLAPVTLTGRYQVAEPEGGELTIICQRDEGGPLMLSPDGQPVRAARGALDGLRKAYDTDGSIALVGIGDGHLLKLVCEDEARETFAEVLPFFVIEEDLELVVTDLMAHDYSGPGGPIEQQHVYWCVGEDWAPSLLSTLLDDLQLQPPLHTVANGVHASRMLERLQSLLTEHKRRCTERIASFQEQIEAHYDSVTREEQLELLGPNPPRAPRVLLLTTRFSSVLQFSISDTAQAFERLGWETRTCIERSDHHRHSRLAMRQCLLDFRPDIVLQINHLRFEHGEVFPSRLPFVCWIQDHMPHLIDPATGTRVETRDFVLVGGAGFGGDKLPQQYHELYDYPLRQLIYMCKATRPVRRPRAVRQDGDDLVFVSNCAADPSQIRAELAERLPDPALQRLLSACVERLVALYQEDRALLWIGELRELVQDLERELGLLLADDVRVVFAREIWTRLNDRLFRQQSVRWVLEAARELDLTVGLHGRGWEKREEFAPHARGYVEYGADLEALTRRSKVNLHLSPATCMHQRVLDGVMCGGFYLIRHHPKNEQPEDLFRFFDIWCSPETHDTDAALRAIPASEHETFQSTLHRYRRYLYVYDENPLKWWRSVRAQGHPGSLPHYKDVCFDSPACLVERIRTFIDAPQARREISEAQREFVERHFTYEGQLARVIPAIRERLEREPSDGVSPGPFSGPPRPGDAPP